MNDVTGMPQTAVVVGGGSDLARAVLRRLAGRRLRAVVLAGRRAETMEPVAAELRALGVAEVETEVLDLADPAAIEELVAGSSRRLGVVDLVLVATGALGPEDLEELGAAEVERLALANFSGPAAAMVAFARQLRRQGSGRIVLFSSMAGVRVRRANFVYGGAKAGIDGLAEGLADALAGSGVSLTVVRPGFVRTKMTAGRPAQPMPAEAEDVAAAVLAGLERNSAVVYVPPLMRPLSLAMRLVPRALWRRLPS